MLSSSFTDIKIAAVACAVPTKEVSAESLYRRHGQEFTEKTKKMIAVETVRQSHKKQTASDLGYVAAKAIIDSNNIDIKTVGLLIFVTQTPDYFVPATSCVLHKRLGLTADCAAVDINNGCAGFVYGAHVACSMLSSLNCKRALLVIGDTSSDKRALTKKEKGKRVSVPFGDGTGAVLFEKCERTAPVSITLCTDGGGYGALIKPFGALRGKTYTREELKIGSRGEGNALMSGVDVFNFSITRVPEQINSFVAAQGKAISDYDCVALHQPNLYMIKQIAKKIGADMARVPVSLTRYGNTSGAAIPLTLVDAYGGAEGNLVDKELSVLMCGFGVGLMWGTMSAKIRVGDILPMIFSDDYFFDPELDEKEYDS